MFNAKPFGLQINFNSGKINGAKLSQRRLSDMRGLYADSAALEQIISTEGDRLVYEVFAADLPETEGNILYCTTVIQPGQVGNEYHMTKGHYHARRDRAEIYVGIAGNGQLLLQLEAGTLRAVPMGPGTAAYVPPYWGHRTVNTGAVPFSFFAAWPGDAGHDYGAIAEVGFGKLLVAHDGQPVLIDNPRR